MWDGRVRTTEVDIPVDDGKVTLRGTVPSYRAKMAAAEDAWTVAGVKAVDNQLQVQYPPTSVPTDSEIASNIKTVLNWDADIDGSKIDVSVTEGIVTLRGTVDAYWKKFQAQEDAYWMNGTIEVVNELAVVPTHKASDETIARSLEAALERRSNVDVEHVSVAVENGTVTLTGNVPDWSAWNTVYNTALFTTGVSEVRDRLAIGAE
jgi:osmotically-inducible protein OsmY